MPSLISVLYDRRAMNKIPSWKQSNLSPSLLSMLIISLPLSLWVVVGSIQYTKIDKTAVPIPPCHAIGRMKTFHAQPFHRSDI
jgi:hypothetical protein